MSSVEQMKLPQKPSCRLRPAGNLAAVGWFLFVIVGMLTPIDVTIDRTLFYSAYGTVALIALASVVGWCAAKRSAAPDLGRIPLTTLLWAVGLLACCTVSLTGIFHRLSVPR
jgi:hypothetical protein